MSVTVQIGTLTVEGPVDSVRSVISKTSKEMTGYQIEVCLRKGTVPIYVPRDLINGVLLKPGVEIQAELVEGRFGWDARTLEVVG